jgi:hypothetical protein
MCDPLSIGIATAALSVGQQVTSYIGTNQASAANQVAANLNFARENEAISRQKVQLDKQASENALDTAITAARARGEITASASDRGLASSSITQQINAAMFGVGRQASIEDINLTSQRRNLLEGRVDADIKRQSQIASMPKAGAVSLILGVGSGLAKGASAYKSAGGQ